MLVEDLFDLLLKRFGHQHWWPGESRQEIIIGAILTQNTNWKNVEKSLDNLLDQGLLNFKKIHKIERSHLARLIYSSGYYNQKAKRLKKIAEFFLNNEDIDRMETKTLRRKLLALNGIGPETADSILLYAYQRPVFVIDTYTKRIGWRLGFWGEKISYEDAQIYFQKRFPADEKKFNEFHALLVKLGKDYCKKKALCSKCFLQKKCQKMKGNYVRRN